MSYVYDLITQRTDWLEHLIEEHKISVSKDDEADPRLVSLKYNQIESDMSNPMVQECRGMVVDIKAKKILAHPYNKFHNFGDYLAQDIAWESAAVQEKLDGSLMILFCDNQEDSVDGYDDLWRVASSGHPTAGGNVNGNSLTFRELFWQTFASLGMKIPRDEKWMRESTFMFELCTKNNRIVVRHQQPRLVCHGARHVPSGQEWSRSELELLCKDRNWEIVKQYPIGTIEDALKAAEELDPLQTEGFVVVDHRYHRVKIKSPRYVALHHLKGNDNVNPRRVIELWQAGEVEELLVHFEELREDVEPIIANLEQIAQQALADFQANSHLLAPDDRTPAVRRKDFAMAVKDKPGSAIIFKLLGEVAPGIDSTRAILRSSNVGAIERLLGNKNEDL